MVFEMIQLWFEFECFDSRQDQLLLVYLFVNILIWIFRLRQDHLLFVYLFVNIYALPIYILNPAKTSPIEGTLLATAKKNKLLGTTTVSGLDIR